MSLLGVKLPVFSLLFYITQKINNFFHNPLLLVFYVVCSSVGTFVKVFSISVLPQVTQSSQWVAGKTTPELLVGYYNIHPFFLYAGLLRLTVSISSQSFFQTQLNNLFQCSATALVLGAHWGWGNSSWGFFWVGDVIEWLLLLLIIIILAVIHSFKSSIYVARLLVVLAFLYEILVNLRLGLIFSRHSFFSGTKVANILIWACILASRSLASYFFLKILFSISKIIWLTSFTLHHIEPRLKKKKTFHKIILGLALIWVVTVPNNQSFLLNKSPVFFQNLYKGSLHWSTHDTLLGWKKILKYSLYSFGQAHIKHTKYLSIVTSHPNSLYFWGLL